MNQTQQLLQQIAALPNTTLFPFSQGGGYKICENRPSGVSLTSVWTDRKSTVELLQSYLARRQATNA